MSKRKPPATGQNRDPWRNRIVGHGVEAPDQLLANPKNWRLHPKDQQAALKGALDEIGWLDTVKVNQTTGNLVDGHLRVILSMRHGIEEVPVTYLELTQEEEDLALATFDPISAKAGTDTDKLAEILGLVQTDNDGINDLLNDLAKKAGLTEVEGPDGPKEPKDPTPRAEKLAEKWGTARGQIWQIGPHRLAIGDATDPETWKKLMVGMKACCVFTDPPYGVSYESTSGNHRKIANDELTGDALVTFLTKVFKQLYDQSEPDAAFYIWYASSSRDDFAYAMKAVGIIERQQIIWAKPAPVLGWADYHWSHEPCFYASKEEKSPPFYGDRANNTVWKIGVRGHDGQAVTVGQGGIVVTDGEANLLYVAEKPPKGKKLRVVRVPEGERATLTTDNSASDFWEVSRESNPDHPTQKPTELARRAIVNSTAPGELVIDAFLGSGCTMIGAEQTGRVCYGTELQPTYGAVILERMQELGLVPTKIA